MTKAIIILFITTCLCLSCSKNGIEPVSGSINGLPAVTLYGTSNKPTDYIFLVTAKKEMSYNSLILTYVYTNGSGNISVLDSGYSIATGTLDTSGAKITLSIYATGNFTFASNIYSAY